MIKITSIEFVDPPSVFEDQSRIDYLVYEEPWVKIFYDGHIIRIPLTNVTFMIFHEPMVDYDVELYRAMGETFDNQEIADMIAEGNLFKKKV